MEYLVANVDHLKFDIEIALDEQYGALPLPFTGMDSKFRLCLCLFNEVVIIRDISSIIRNYASTDHLLSTSA